MNFSLYHSRDRSCYISGDTFIGPQCYAAPSIIDPASIPGLNLWLKADALTGLANADPLTTWPDSSSLANDANQSTAGNKPTYRTNILNGKPIIRFDGTDDFLTVAGNITPIDIFAVVKFGSGTDSGVVLGNTPAAAAVFTRLSGNISISDEFNTIQAANISTNFQLLSARLDTIAYLRLNGVQVATGSLASALQTPTYIGSDSDTLQNLNGDLAELLIYNTLLSSANRNAIETYLNQKYALF